MKLKDHQDTRFRDLPIKAGFKSADIVAVKVGDYFARLRARRQLFGAAKRAEHRSERVEVVLHDKVAVYVISSRDHDMLEELERRRDLWELEEALHDPRNQEREPRAWSDIKAGLGE